MVEKTEKHQVNMRLEPELYEFLVEYSKKNYKTVTAVLREMIAKLYLSESKENNQK